MKSAFWLATVVTLGSGLACSSHARNYPVVWPNDATEARERFADFERERSRLLQAFRNGGDPRPLVELARMEAQAGLLGIAALHITYAAGLDQSLVAGDVRLCQVLAQRAQVLARRQSYIAADSDWRRVQVLCPDLKTPWPSWAQRQDLARAAQCQLERLSRPLPALSAVRFTEQSTAQVDAPEPLTTWAYWMAEDAVPSSDALAQMHQASTRGELPVPDRDDVNRWLATYPDLATSLTWSRPREGGETPYIDATLVGDRARMQALADLKAGRWSTVTQAAERLRDDPFVHELSLLAEWGATLETLAQGNSKPNVPYAGWFEPTIATRVREVLLTALRDPAVLTRNESAAALIVACESDVVPSDNCRLGVPLLASHGHSAALAQLAERWIYGAPVQDPGFLLTHFEVALSQKLDGRAERLAMQAAAQAIDPVATWASAADLAVLYGRGDVERISLVRLAAHAPELSYEVERRLLAWDLALPSRAAATGTQVHQTHALTERLRKHLADPRAQGPMWLEWQRLLSQASARGLAVDDASRLPADVPATSSLDPTHEVRQRLFDGRATRWQNARLPSVMGHVIVGTWQARQSALREVWRRLPPEARLPVVSHLLVAPAAVVPHWDAGGGLSWQRSPMVANQAALQHVIFHPGQPGDLWSTSPLLPRAYPVNAHCEPTSL